MTWVPAVEPRGGRLLLVLLAAVPAMSGTARGLLVPGLKLSDLLAIALLFGVGLRWQWSGRLLDPLGTAVCLYAVTYTACLFVSVIERPEVPSGVIPKELFAVPQYLLLYVIAFVMAQNAGATALAFFRKSLGFAVVIALMAALQMLDVGGVRELLATLTGNPEVATPLEWRVYRGTGLFPSWHALAMYMAIHIVVGIAVLSRCELSARESRRLRLGVLACGVGLLTTLTATPTLIALAGALYFSVKRGQFRYVLTLGVLGLLAYRFTSLGDKLDERFAMQFGSGVGEPQTLTFRVQVWTDNWLPIIENHLLSGFGPLTDVERARLFSYAESMYITVLLAGGIPLLLVFLAVMFTAVKRMGAVAKEETGPASTLGAMARAMEFVAFTLIFAQILHPYLNDAGAASLFFTLTGWISGYAVREQRSGGGDLGGDPGDVRRGGERGGRARQSAGSHSRGVERTP